MRLNDVRKFLSLEKPSMMRVEAEEEKLIVYLFYCLLIVRRTKSKLPSH